MNVKRSAATCRWATATLHMPAPIWLQSWDRPWTCLRGPGIRPLATTDACASCPRWEPNGRRLRSEVWDLEEPVECAS